MMSIISSSSQFTEPQENIVAQSITIIDYDGNQKNHIKLYIGTRNGWLIEYDFINDKKDEKYKDNDDNKIISIDTDNPIFRNIGELPVTLVPIQLNISDEEENELNMTRFKGKNGLLCISERCFILFLNDKNKLELWPLDYPSNSISYATSFNRMSF